MSGWRKSSFSNIADCVEVRREAGRILVRDSKDPEGTHLTLTLDAWRAFTGAARLGELDA